MSAAPVRCQQRPVEAMQYDGSNFDAIAGWVHGKGGMCAQMLGQPRINVGTGWAEAGDWIISGRFGFTHITHVCFEEHYDVLAPAPDMITVCDRCLRACCWKGVFMCDDSQNAGTRELSAGTLAIIDREHPDYWDGTYERQVEAAAAKERGEGVTVNG
jgi:hypothetical protein